MAAQAQIPSEQKETREKTISHTSLQKTQSKEFLSINACYSVTKYYLCRQNNKRSLLGRKQQSQVARSFPKRYLFSYTNKVTSLFSISCILDIIFPSHLYPLLCCKVQHNFQMMSNSYVLLMYSVATLGYNF